MAIAKYLAICRDENVSHSEQLFLLCTAAFDQPGDRVCHVDFNPQPATHRGAVQLQLMAASQLKLKVVLASDCLLEAPPVNPISVDADDHIVNV